MVKNKYPKMSLYCSAK